MLSAQGTLDLINRIQKRVNAGGFDAYRFESRHCFVTAGYLFPGQYKHLRHAFVIGLVTDLRYAVQPGNRLFIVPDRSEDLPVVVIDHLQFVGERYFDLCAADVQIVSSKDGLTLQHGK